MNSNEKNLRALLDDVLPVSAEDCGPSRGDVSAILRSERARRRRLRSGTATLVLTALISVSLLWRDERIPWSSIMHAPTKPRFIIVHEVNDDQLLALLHDIPAALMEWPNGDRTLLVVEQGTSP